MKRTYVAGFAVAAFVLAGTAFAQQVTATQGAKPATPASGPAGIPVGPLTVYPGVNFAYGHDDNLFYSNLNRRGSDVTILSPYVKVEAKPGPHKFDATFQIDDGRYRSSASDNYTDYSLIGNGDMVFTGRAGLKVRAEARHGHDPRGSTDRPGGATPDEWDNTGAEGVFSYGAPGARGRIEVDAGWYKREYTNNRASTVAADRKTGQLGGTFYWRVMPRTELLFQAGYRNIDYDLATSTLDSTEQRYLVGAKWDATAKTTGYAKFGQLKKKFDSGTRTDFSGSSWDVGVRWSPLTYSVFDFTSSKQTYESTGVGDTVVGSLYGVTWSHAWSSRLRSQALAQYRKDDFAGSGATRQDKTQTFGLKVGYDFRRWLNLGAQYTRTNRDSNVDAVDYNRNLFLFTVGATL